MANADDNKSMGFFAGTVVQGLRTDRGWTQAELAARLGEGWNANRVSRIENDSLSLTRPVIELLAEVFVVRPEKLYLDCLRAKFEVLREGRLAELLLEIDEELEDLLAD